MAFPPRRERERIIIALDVDNFYVASERLRDPSLIGRPVGITQKTILATCSYEAREKGVKKLSLIGDAKRLCPEIILRSGEDLTHYRQHSRRIWRLVNGLIGSSPEKLGMDELFIDATPLIDAHLANEAEREARYFRLGNPDEAFTYEGDLAGFPYGRAEDEMSEANIRLAIASHLADYVRRRILHDEGFSTSAGVAPNKLLAKLLASENKPAKQTTWLPPADAEARRQAVQNYLGPLPLNKLNGFGHRYIMTLRQKLLGEPERPGNGWMDAHPNMAIDDEGDYFSNPFDVYEEPEPLTVAQARELATAKQMQDIFGERLGARLWGLLFGIDDEPVNPTPAFPKTISVEDSYLRAKLPTVSLALDKIRSLSTSLLNRLELELVDEPLSLLPTTVPRTWARHPTQIRLSLRGGPGAGSKTVPMPLDTLDLAVDKGERAEKLSMAFGSLFKKMIGPTLAASKERVSIHVINLAVVGFQADAPTPSVRTLLRKRPADTDLNYSRSAPAPPLEAVWLDDDEDGEEEDDQQRCEICSSWVPSFAFDAHASWHLEPG